MEVSSQLHAPPGETAPPPPNQWGMGGGGPPGGAGQNAENKNLLLLPGIEPQLLSCEVNNLVTLLTEMSHVIPSLHGQQN
jgi:hypothetical protein